MQGCGLRIMGRVPVLRFAGYGRHEAGSVGVVMGGAQRSRACAVSGK